MDPNITLHNFLLVLGRFEQNSSLSLSALEEEFETLFEWLKNGGFPPDVLATILSVQQILEEE